MPKVKGSGNILGRRPPSPTEEDLIEAVFEGRRFGRRIRAMRIETGDLEDRERLNELLLLNIPDNSLNVEQMNFVLRNVIEMSDTGLLDTLVEELGDDDDDDEDEDDDRRTLSDVSSEEMVGDGKTKVKGSGNIFGRRRVQVAPAPSTEPEQTGRLASSRTPTPTGSGKSKKESRIRARELGREYGKMMMEKDEEYGELMRGGFLDFFRKGLADIVPKIVGAVATQIIKDPTKLSVAGVARPFVNRVVAPVVGATMGTKGKIAQKALEALTSDTTRDAIAKRLSGRGVEGDTMDTNRVVGGAGYADPKKYGKGVSGGEMGEKKPKRKASPAILKRSQLIKKLMREEGLSMIEASKAVKSRGLM